MGSVCPEAVMLSPLPTGKNPVCTSLFICPWHSSTQSLQRQKNCSPQRARVQSSNRISHGVGISRFSDSKVHPLPTSCLRARANKQEVEAGLAALKELEQ